MIKTIANTITELYGKQNWIDQNNIVFGFSDSQQCCEAFGWGVYDPITKEKVADEPDGLPYHFDFASGAKENDSAAYLVDEYGDSPDDWVQVELVHDTDPKKRLVLECYNYHNGYYYHDFSFFKKEA